MRARLLDSVVSSVALWGMETVAARQKDRETYHVVLDESDQAY